MLERVETQFNSIAIHEDTEPPDGNAAAPLFSNFCTPPSPTTLSNSATPHEEDSNEDQACFDNTADVSLIISHCGTQPDVVVKSSKLTQPYSKQQLGLEENSQDSLSEHTAIKVARILPKQESSNTKENAKTNWQPVAKMVAFAILPTIIGSISEGMQSLFASTEYAETIPDSQKQYKNISFNNSLLITIAAAKAIQSIALELPYAFDSVKDSPSLLEILTKWRQEFSSHPGESTLVAAREALLFILNLHAGLIPGITTYLGVLNMEWDMSKLIYPTIILAGFDLWQVFTSDASEIRKRLKTVAKLLAKIEAPESLTRFLKIFDQFNSNSYDETRHLIPSHSTSHDCTEAMIISPAKSKLSTADKKWLAWFVSYGILIGGANAAFSYFTLSEFGKRTQLAALYEGFYFHVTLAVAGSFLGNGCMDAGAIADKMSGRKDSQDFETANISDALAVTESSGTIATASKTLSNTAKALILPVTALVAYNAFCEFSIAIKPFSSDDSPWDSSWYLATIAAASGLFLGAIPEGVLGGGAAMKAADKTAHCISKGAAQLTSKLSGIFKRKKAATENTATEKAAQPTIASCAV